jgi:hypothetical protein
VESLCGQKPLAAQGARGLVARPCAPVTDLTLMPPRHARPGELRPQAPSLEAERLRAWIDGRFAITLGRWHEVTDSNQWCNKNAKRCLTDSEYREEAYSDFELMIYIERLAGSAEKRYAASH